FVQRDQRTERERRERIAEQRAADAIPLEYAMRHQCLGHALGAHLIRASTERQRLTLRKQVRDQEIVHVLAAGAQDRTRPAESDEIAGHAPRALMQKLVERVLAVGARLAPPDRTGASLDRRAIHAHALAVALHRK